MMPSASSTATIFPPQSYATSFKLFKKQLKARTLGDGTTPNVFDCLGSVFLTNKATTTEIEDPSSKSNDKGIDLRDLWRFRKSVGPQSAASPSSVVQKPPKPITKSNLTNGFKKWRKSTASSRNSTVAATPNNVNSKQNRDDEMSLLKFLAINALDLTAPASDILLKSRTDQWFQLSGHPDTLAPAGPGTVWKKRAGGTENTEREVYEALSADPNMKDVIPRYFREVDYQSEKFIELQDLLHNFKDPNVMDIKMGTRTFLESEVSKTTARSDLYKKMVAVDPKAPTEAEHQEQAITKLRYMQFREQQSSSCSQGFRIEAMKCRGSEPVTDLKRVKSRNEVKETMKMFLAGKEHVREQVLERLMEIRTKFENCEYFRTHEVIGSSIFMIYDDNKVGVWMIDFAKTSKVPDGVTLTHREPWKQGNHEEGFLLGLDRLISVFDEIRLDSCNDIPPPEKVTS